MVLFQMDYAEGQHLAAVTSGSGMRGTHKSSIILSLFARMRLKTGPLEGITPTLEA